MTSALVTGAAGFVGRRLVDHLVGAGCDVVAVVRPGTPPDRLADLEGAEVVAADLSDPHDVRRLVRSAVPDVTYHLAWYTDPQFYVHAVEENLASARSSLLLVEELLRAGSRRLVAAGTCAEYGLSPYPLEESSPPRPGTMYGAAKLAVATAAAAAARTTGAKLTWARIFYLFGPGEDRRRPVPAHTLQLLQGGTVTVENPDDVRDYLHVDDVVSALVTLADAEFSGVANVCSGVPTTQRQLLSTLAELTGGSLREPDSTGADQSPVRRTEGRATALELLGWRPARDLHEGLADTVAWWKARSY